MRWALSLTLVVVSATASNAQIHGSASVMLDVLPDPDEAPGNQPVTEIRTRLFAERRQEVGDHFRVALSGYVDALIADRNLTTRVTDATVRPVDLFAEWVNPRFAVRVGASRIVWGRLDEFQPTDVINPIDLTRFLLEGRSEARLAVGLVHSYLFLGKSTLEAVIVPRFHAARFDQLDEETSAFNVTADVTRTTVTRTEPDFAWNNVQGGARFNSTMSRVDWSVSAYRGFRAFPIVTALVTPAGANVTETFPRFTMIGGDFETVRGVWGVRGEVAAMVDDELQASTVPRGVSGKSVEAGVGLDRRAGDYRLGANVLWSWRSADDVDALGVADESLHGSDVTLVIAADRSFVRETRTVRAFGVYNPGDRTAFGRVIAAVSIRDNVWLEGSGGVFTGTSTDVIGHLSRRDFLYGRLKVFF